MIMQYAKDKDVWKKRLAMYMIIHVGWKFEKYRISPLSDLLPVFRDLYACEDMKTFIDDTAEDFFKSNFDQ